MNRNIAAFMMVGTVGMVCLAVAGRSARGQEQQAPFGMVTGTVAHRQRIALPPDTKLRVRLEDVSRQDVAARLISEVTLPTASKQVPLAFVLPFRRADIDAQHRYQVRATLVAGDEMMFTTTSAYPVLTQGTPSDVAIVVQSVAPRPAAVTPSRFVDRVWKVRTSRQVAPGQLYTFLTGGTLVIASRTSKPALGSWSYKSGILTITEEGRPYKVDIIRLIPGEFRLKIRGPGTPVEMTLVPASGAA